MARNGDLFTKTDFKINVRALTITCPAGEVEPIRPGFVVTFGADACDQCPLRAQCTDAARGSGRNDLRRVAIIQNLETIQRRLEAQAARAA